MSAFDVIVLGGGSAGMAAGVAAARAGAKTLIVERHAYLGGMASAALVHSVCGLYKLDESEPVYANPGLASEFAEALMRCGASPGPVRMGRVTVLPHHPVGFIAAADELVKAEPNLAIRFHTEVTGVVEKGEGWGVAWFCRGNVGTWTSRALIDATGDAVGAKLAGRAVLAGSRERMQRPAYVFGMSGVPTGFVTDDGRLHLSHALVEAVRAGKADSAVLGAHFRGIGRDGDAFCTLDLSGGETFDPLDPDCLTGIEQTGRELAFQVVASLRDAIPELGACRISQFPARAGVRESRQVVTEHLFTGQEWENGEPFEDEIAVACWPAELRERATGPKWRYPKSGGQPRIPLRSLLVKGAPGFFVAGRCLGADRQAQASIRVIGTCLATGEAAGAASALYAAGETVSALKIRAFREKKRPSTSSIPSLPSTTLPPSPSSAEAGG